MFTVMFISGVSQEVGVEEVDLYMSSRDEEDQTGRFGLWPVSFQGFILSFSYLPRLIKVKKVLFV